LKQNPHSKSRGNGLVDVGIAGLRAEAVDMSPVSNVSTKMLATEPPVKSRSVAIRYLLVGGAAAGAACFAFWPHVSNAASLHEVDAALSHQSSRYEEVLRPDASGQLKPYMEVWGKAGKAAMRFADGVEFRQN